MTLASSFLLTLLLAVPLVAQKAAPETNATASQLILSDAEILVYLTPAAKAVRKTGVDVLMDQSTSEKLNLNDYYVFQMLSTRTCEACSTTVGHFAVNKHTADVRTLDVDDYRLLTTGEIAGIQRIIRKAHHITQDVLERYRNRPVWADTK